MEFTKQKNRFSTSKNIQLIVKQLNKLEMVKKILGVSNKNLESILKEQQEVQNYLKALFFNFKRWY